MQDGFDKKREMVKMLMDMLKHNAASEVGGTGDASGHPHMADLTRTNALQQRTSDSSKMAEGGLAGTDMSATDEPNRLLEPKGQADSNQDETALGLLAEPPQDEPGQEEARQTLHDENIMHEDEDNNSSSFQAFLKRKR
jgi:hypothetical protein